MTLRLAPGPHTFSTEKLLEVLSSNKYIKSQDGSRPPEFHTVQLSSSQTHNQTNSNTRVIYHNAKSQLAKAKEVCTELLNVCEGDGYIERVDNAMALQLECHLDLQGLPDDVVVARALGMLQRLPFVPPPMKETTNVDIYSKLSERHLLESKQQATWENLSVSSFVDRNVIRMALYFAIYQDKSNTSASTSSSLEHINHVALLLEAGHLLSELETDVSVQQRLFFVKAFLWTSWHRSLLLHFSYELWKQLRLGSNFMARPPQIELSSTGLVAKLSKSSNLPAYMCRWAYELVKTDRATAGLDLRALCTRYETFLRNCNHGKHDARCVINADGKVAQCDGSSPHSCTRFRGLKIENQSSHDPSCSRDPSVCQRMYWNEDSYRGVQGARAVSIETNETDDQLHYCLASPTTISISHVWSHGQGGRPEANGTGFNKCLHQRYCEIARQYDCDSYWMDTPCIPQDHQLRKEAIAEINNVFSNSKLTLVCDRDIMEIDVHSLTMEVKETILATLLVCDWNVRAWTFLESMRGRTNLHLLCKDNETVCLKSLIESVNQDGSTELAVLFLTAQHLIPADIYPIEKSSKKSWGYDQGFLNVEEAACLLSRRYASRPGDELVIWSLLCGNQAYQDPTAFWKAQLTETYHPLVQSYPGRFGITRTGFLVSSAPRITGQRGLSWAPSRPDIAYSDPPSQEKVFCTYDGRDTAIADFDDRGLEANWLVSEFRCFKLASKMMVNLLTPFKQPYLSELRRIGLQRLKAFKWGAILQVTDNNGLTPPRNVYKRGQNIGDKVAVPHRGNNSDHVIVLVGSHDRENWEWLGVYEWDKRVALPECERRIMYIV